MLLWLPVVTFLRLFDRDPAHYAAGRFFRRIGSVMSKINPGWHVCIDGETIHNPRNPYVVVCNHLSLADIPIISCLPWEMKWIAKAELLKVPVLGWLMRLSGDIPVNRDSKLSRARALVTARQYLDDRCSVIFFPEGTRSQDGRLSPFSDGAFRMAIKAQVPILPLVIDGSQDTLPKHSWKFGKAHVRLRVLPPVSTMGLKASDTATLRNSIRETIAEQLASWRELPPERILAEQFTPPLH